MDNSWHRWRYLALSLVLVLVVSFTLPQSARADWILAGDTIPPGQTVENDVLLTGTNVVVDGIVRGDVLAVGSTVTVNGTVEGSLVVVGRTVAVNGQVGGSVYAAGRVLEMGPSSEVGGNLHYVGLLLDSRPGSRVLRDLVVASVRGQISGDVGRALRAFILLLTFDGTIGHGATGALDRPDPGAPPLGRHAPGAPGSSQAGSTLFYVSLGGPKVVGYAAPTRFQQQPDESDGTGTLLPEWLIARLGEFVALLLVGGLAVWLIPSRLGNWAEKVRTKPLPALGFGLLAVAIFANAIAIALLLAVLIFFIGIWLGSVALWTLAFFFWGIAYSSLGFVLSALALTVFFGSKVIIAYLAGKMILGRFAPRLAEHRILLLLLGLILYVLLRSIPTLGWVIEVFVVIFGLGGIWVAFREGRPPAVPAEAEGE
jgi:cytoskeletal protein CcmA (bactofilin family)